MIVYKGFDENMCCNLGKGKYQYRIGHTETEDEAKTRHCGLHASEYVMEACSWYPPNGRNRICICEAQDVDEDGEDIVACKKLTPVKELSMEEICLKALQYMVKHQKRSWKKSGECFEVEEDKASVSGAGIAIARGEHPRCRGGEGSVLGFYMEKDGVYVGAVYLVVGPTKGWKPNTWYQMRADHTVIEVEE